MANHADFSHFGESMAHVRGMVSRLFIGAATSYANLFATSEPGSGITEPARTFFGGSRAVNPLLLISTFVDEARAEHCKNRRHDNMLNKSKNRPLLRSRIVQFLTM